MSTEQAHIELWPAVAWRMPAEVDVEAIAEYALREGFRAICRGLESYGYPVTGDVAPGEALQLDLTFQTFVRMMALNNEAIAALQEADEDEDGAGVEPKVILRKFSGGTESVTYDEFVRSAIQDDQVALEVAQRMLNGMDPYEWNEDEAEFYEQFTIIDRAALEAAVEAAREKAA